jgi:hypoxanthine-guanine phosphoribosyltransferase
MKSKTEEIINQLARQVIYLKQPIHILAICSGGKTVGEQINKYLRQKGFISSCFEVWTNIIKGKSTVWKSNFSKSDYTGTALIVEDVIWKGSAVKATRAMLRKMKNKRCYTASILDCNHKANFAVFR